MAHRPMSVPVLPNPALQWIEIPPLFGLAKWSSTTFMKASTIESGGVEPSTKKRSLWSIPLSVKYFLLYFSSFSLITRVTLNFLNISTYLLGWWPYLCWASLYSMGPMNAINLPGMIQLRSPFSTLSYHSYSLILNVLKSYHLNLIAYSSPCKHCRRVQL